MRKVMLFVALLLTALFVVEVARGIQVLAESEGTPLIIVVLGDEEGLYAVKMNVTGPLGNPIRPQRPFTVIEGRRYFTMRLTIIYPEVADKPADNFIVFIDGRGKCIEPATLNLTLAPYTGGEITINIMKPDGSSLSGFPTRVSARTVWSNGLGTVNISFILSNVSEGAMHAIEPGWTIEITYSLSAGHISLPAGVDRAVIELNCSAVYTVNGRRIFKPITYRITVIRAPMWRLFVVIGLAFGTFAILQVLGYMGWFRRYTDTDLVVMATVGAAQTVWVQIIGRQLVFPILDRIPFTYNFAVGDFPYILLLVIAIAIVRKPGAASLTLFVYNIVSEIGWYGINPLWWAYPFAQGLPVDFYIFLRGRAIFTNKLSFLRSEIPEEEFVRLPEVRGLRYIDGFIVGLLRGFFMQVSLYYVFFPCLFRLEYWMEYVFWWICIPWSIGNAIEAAISVPIAERVEKAIVFA